MRPLYTLLFALFLTLPQVAFTQFFDPIQLNTQIVKTGEQSYDLIYTMNIESGWATYSQELSSDMGPFPTTFTYETEGVQLQTEFAEECGMKETKYDAVFEMDLAKFHDLAVFIQSIEVDPSVQTIEGYVTLMSCDDEKCLPPSDYEFSFKLSGALDQADYDRNKVCEGKSIGANATTDNEEGSMGQADLEAEDEFEDPVQWSFQLSTNADSAAFIASATIQEGWKVYGLHEHGFDGPIPTKIFIDSLIDADTLSETKYISDYETRAYDKFFDLDNLSTIKKQLTLNKRFSSPSGKGRVVGFVEYQTCDSTQCLPPQMVPFIIDFKEGVAYNPEKKSERNFDTKGEGTPVFFEFDHSQDELNCTDREEEKEAGDQSFLWIFLAGFAGGFVALLTPCVFPMIPLTVSFFTKSSKDRASGIRNALTYGGSIILIYVALGLLVTSVFGADALNLLSTNAWFNIFFFVLFVVFALSFFGLFEITLPSSWANKADRAADRGGLIGIFFMAFTLSLVSFSCTGPIIGTLLVETATGGGPVIFGSIPAGPLMGMLGFSSALALPFALFAAFPSWLNSLPKSGSWMNAVKVLLGFVEVALALKFLSVADLTMGWKILPYELFVALWVLCALGIAAYFFGLLKLPLDYAKPKVTTGRAITATIALLLAAYIASGFAYSDRNKTFITPAMLSGLAPPAGHSYIFPNKCPLNINCFKDFDKGVAFAKEENRPILLDFTGHGCVNCRKMEDQVWGEEGVYELISEKYVLISLYVDERTPLEEPYVSAFDGKEKRTIGNKWSDFQAIHFGRNSQPYYVLMNPDGKVLNEPVAYTPDVATYQAFLECGLEEFNKDCGNCLTEK